VGRGISCFDLIAGRITGSLGTLCHRGFIDRLLACWFALAAGLATQSVHAGEKALALAKADYDRPDGEDVATQATMMILTQTGQEPLVRRLYALAIGRGERERWVP
jgi:hypothetical protein